MKKLLLLSILVMTVSFNLLAGCGAVSDVSGSEVHEPVIGTDSSSSSAPSAEIE